MRVPFRLGLSSVILAGAIVACSSTTTTSAPPATGGDGATPDPDSGSPEPEDSSTSPEAAAAPFKLTSTALAEGASFAADNTCTGTNVSPPFAWGPGPAATLSYAIWSGML